MGGVVFRCVHLGLLLMCLVSQGYAQESYDWVREFGDDQYSYVQTSINVDLNDGVVTAGTYRLPGEGDPFGKVAGLWVWAVEGTGRTGGFFRVENAALDPAINEVDAVAPAGESRFFVVVRTAGVGSRLLMVGRDGDVEADVPLEGRVINKITRWNDVFLLVGHRNYDSLLLIIDQSGKVLAEKVYDRGRDDLISDVGVFGGKIVAVEVSGESEQFFTRDANLIVSIFDRDLQQEKTILRRPGRDGLLTGRGNNDLAVMYDAGVELQQDIRLLTLSGKHQVAKETKIIERKFGLEKFRLVGNGRGDVVVAGTVEHKPWVVMFDENDKVVPLTMPQAVVTTPSAVMVDGGLYVSYTVMRISKKKQSNNKVMVVRHTLH